VIRRWLRRLLALVALGGVTYGIVQIVSSGTKGGGSPKAALNPQLRALAAGQEALAVRLENLRPGHVAPRLLPAIRRARHRQTALVVALHRLDARNQPVRNEGLLQDALDAEFDYLDALGSVARSRHSPLIKVVGDRAQKANDAFTALPDSAGVENGIRGTQAFLTWARARH
jgi:hypothetical protein